MCGGRVGRQAKGTAGNPHFNLRGAQTNRKTRHRFESRFFHSGFRCGVRAGRRSPNAPYSSYGVYSGTRRFIALLISALMPESATTRKAVNQPSSCSVTASGKAFNR